LTKHDIEREDDGMSKSLIYKMRCGCEFWEGLDYVGEVYSEMQYCAKHDNFPKLRSRIAELEEFKSAYYSLEKDNNKLRDIIINLEEELAQLRNQIKELEARTTWQPIETAPIGIKFIAMYGNSVGDVYFKDELTDCVCGCLYRHPQRRKR
jgi:hypothetical protein